MIRFYGYKKCSTCRKAEKALESKHKQYQFIDITEKPPSATALKQMSRQSGEPVSKLFNTSGQAYREMKIKDQLPTMNEAQVFKLLSGNGRLIKRPLVTDGKKTTIGFQDATFKKTWKC